ncbi:MAG: cytochrome P450 [Deltaproteobacteria bacterium]|jgi:cytochrome P450|nr:cytochrome P450 [Deltaproteobacteria bacterium]
MAVLSLADASFLQDPYPAIHEHRPAGVIPNINHGGVWLLASDEIRKVVRDPSFSSDPDKADPEAPITGVLKAARLSIFYMDPPEHTRIRGLVAKEFSPHRVRELGSGLEKTARSVLDQLPDGGVVDLAATFADVIPMIVMSDFLGVEEEIRADFRDWGLTRVKNLFDPVKNRSPEFAEASQNLRDYFTQKVAKRREEPATDLVGRLVEATDEQGSDLRDQEIIDLLILLVGAGIITTADLIGNAVHALLTHPKELAKLYADSSRIPEAIEETLRFDAPALSVGRIATEETDLCGQRIAPGTWIRVMTSAIGRDPAIHPDPDRFCLDRDQREHMAFGGGAHFCLGAHLGKAEARIALRILLERFPDLCLAEGEDVAVRRSVPGFRGLERLMVRLA